MRERLLDALDTLAQIHADDTGKDADLVRGYLWCLQDLGVPIEDASEADTLASLLAAGLVELRRD